MTSSPTREVDPDMLSAVLADHDERRPCPTPCRDQSERGGCLCAITAATLRALLARAEAAERGRAAADARIEELTAVEAERDALQAQVKRLRNALQQTLLCGHTEARNLARAALAGEAGQ